VSSSSNIRFVFSDARVWRYVLRTLADYLEVVGMKLSPTQGVRIRAMDPSRVMLIDFSIPLTAFEEYVVEKEETLFLNLENVSKILRRASKSDKLAISSDGSRLSLSLISKGGTERTFILPLISSTYEEVPELSLEFKVVAKILGPALSLALSILEDVGDVAKFRVLKDGLSLMASTELGEVEFLFNTATGTLIDYQIAEDVNEFTNMYSMEYVSTLTQLSKLAETATIRLAPEIPCEIDLDLIGGASLKVFIAPRVE